jgi:L-lactate dehydrogenase complex protein LldG
MSAREAILKRLRTSAPTALPSLPDVTGWFATHRRSEDTTQRISRLRSALEAVQAQVHDTTDAAWPDLLLSLAAAKGLRNLLIGTDTPDGSALQERPMDGLQLVRYQQPIDSWRASLFDDIDASLTRAKSAIAETGSLVLWPSASEPRLMSLVPPVHFVLLDVTTIHADLHAAMQAEGWKDALPTNALLICGPSKTADIQQTLAYGAHGPRELVVLLCHPEGVRS